jgi:hypothetical protein
VGVAVPVLVGVGVGVLVDVGVDVGVAVAVAVGVELGVAVGVALGVGVEVGVGVAVAVGVEVGVAVGVALGVADAVVVGACPLGNDAALGTTGKSRKLLSVSNALDGEVVFSGPKPLVYSEWGSVTAWTKNQGPMRLSTTTKTMPSAQ